MFLYISAASAGILPLRGSLSVKGGSDAAWRVFLEEKIVHRNAQGFDEHESMTLPGTGGGQGQAMRWMATMVATMMATMAAMVAKSAIQKNKSGNVNGDLGNLWERGITTSLLTRSQAAKASPLTLDDTVSRMR